MNKLNHWILDDEQPYYMPKDVQDGLAADNDISGTNSNSGTGGDNGGIVRRAVAAMNARSGLVNWGQQQQQQQDVTGAVSNMTTAANRNRLETIPLTPPIQNKSTTLAPYHGGTTEDYDDDDDANDDHDDDDDSVSDNGAISDTKPAINNSHHHPSASSSSRSAALKMMMNGGLRKENPAERNNKFNKDAPGFVAISSSREDGVYSASSNNTSHAGGALTNNNEASAGAASMSTSTSSSSAPSRRQSEESSTAGGDDSSSSPEELRMMNRNQSYLAFFRSSQQQPPPPPLPLPTVPGSSLFANSLSLPAPYRFERQHHHHHHYAHNTRQYRSNQQQQQLVSSSSSLESIRGEPQAVSPYQHFHSVKAPSAVAPSYHQQQQQQFQQQQQQPLHNTKPARFISSLPDPTVFSAITEDRSFPPKTTTGVATVVATQQRPTVKFHPSSLPLSPSSTSSQSPLHSSQSMSTSRSSAMQFKSSLRSPRTKLGGNGGGTEETSTIDGEDSLLGERCFPESSATTLGRTSGTTSGTYDGEDSSYMPNSLNEESTEMVAIAYNLHRLKQLERQNNNNINMQMITSGGGSNNNNNNSSSSRPISPSVYAPEDLLSPQTEPTGSSENHRPCGGGGSSFTPCAAATSAAQNSILWSKKEPLVESVVNNNPRSPNSPVSLALTDAGHAASKSSAEDDDDSENVKRKNNNHQRMLSIGKQLCMSPDLSNNSLDTPPPPRPSPPRPASSMEKMQNHSAAKQQQHAMTPESPGSLASQSQLLGESFVSLMPARSLTPSTGSTLEGEEEAEEDDDDDNSNVNDGNTTRNRGGTTTSSNRAGMGNTNLCSGVPSGTDKFGVMCSAASKKEVDSVCKSIRSVQHSLCSPPAGPTRDDCSSFTPYGSVMSSVQPKSRRRRGAGQSSSACGGLLDSHSNNNNRCNNIPPPSISICSLFRQTPQMPPWRRRLENVQERAVSVVVGIGGQLHKISAGAVNVCRGTANNNGAHDDNIHSAVGATRTASTNLAAVPLSPPRRPNGTRQTHAEQDLNDLTERHRQKVRQLAQRYNADQSNPAAAPLLHDDEYFDFCLVLQPQEAYAFWAGLLDFRVEILGQEAVDALDQACETMRKVNGTIPKTIQEVATGSSDDDDGNSSIHVDDEESGRSRENSSRFDDEGDSLMSILTPNPRCNIGVYNRRVNSTAKKESSMTPVCLVPPKHPVSSSKFVAPSPGFYSVATAGCGATLMSIQSAARLSVFERALFSNPRTGHEMGDDTLSLQAEAAAAPCTLTFGLNSSAQQHRIKWGNHATLSSTKAKPTIFYNNSQKKNPNLQQLCTNSSALSPPVQSLAQDGSSKAQLPGTTRPQRLAAAGTDTHPEVVSKSSTNRSRDHTVIGMESIPNQVIPRGIAARTNGMIPFLNALTTRGIVVRRHRPGHEALFYRIYSEDRGDTLQYKIVDNHKQAMQAFEEQREKYNKRTLSSMDGENIDPQMDELRASPWSYATTETALIKDGAATGDVVSNALKAIKRGSVRTADIVAIHPARHQDPRSEEGEKGTSTLRRSKSEYVEERSFSIVHRSSQSLLRGNSASLDEVENRWYKGEGNDNFFKYVDFEAATEGEYWLLFRGLLLLHRDAAVGRFAEQRAAGIGSHYCRLEGELSDHIDGGEKNRLHNDEFHEPVTVGCMERLLVKLRNQDTTYMKGFTLEGAVAPPSDFFLGFRTPGTAIWSRLRYAGLTTQRLYSLDPRQVVIKVSCPSYRLMDVAEVLRVKLKTLDGSFAPFRQDMIDIFRQVDDPLEHCLARHHSEFQFRSSVRQAIIDFIIRSRIRDSGAELGQATVKRPSGLDSLGKMIQARVPLHMHGKLDAIYTAWFYFWREQNWDGRDGKSLSHEHTASLKGKRADDISITTGESTDGVSTGDDTSSSGGGKIPPLYQRFFVGSLHQPLDSIEEYFGEKVAFYFAWLQHTAGHLVFLSVVGFIVFICQVSTMSWDHPLRPVFAMVVMLWTFVVLINWRKRANFLAYRWGTMNYKEQEVTRPQFQGEFVKDDITGEDVIRYPQWKRWLKYTISLPVTILFTMGTLIVILWVHANRDVQLARYLEQKTNPGSDKFHFEFAISAIGERAPIVEMQLTQELFFDPTFWFIVVGMPALLGLFLPLLNFILMRLSIALNDFENYRTESDYRTNLIIKVFSFRFVCYFATLYYYAFVSVGTTQAVENGILRVGSGVLVYTTVAHWWQVILQICLPLLIRKVRMHYRGIKLCNALREIEMEEEHVAELDASTTPDEIRKRQVKLVNKRLLLEQAQDEIWLELMRPEHDSFNEYINAVVLFAFVTCFSVVLPITPLICLINYLISMRLDAYKVCRGRRRPLAEKTGGIGIWLHLMHIVAVISVLTNCWLMGFTNEFFLWIGEQIGELGLLALVVAWEHVMLLIKYIMQTSISPLPKSVQDAMKKEKHLLDEQRTKELRDRQQGRRTQYQHDDLIPDGNGSQPLSSLMENPTVRLRTSAIGSRSISWNSSGPSSFDTNRDQMSPMSSQPSKTERVSFRTPSTAMRKQDFNEEVASALYSA